MNHLSRPAILVIDDDEAVRQTSAEMRVGGSPGAGARFWFELPTGFTPVLNPQVAAS
jgi:hypothetical protein